MPLRFTVLASGSAGNASLIETSRFGVLLDAGLGPRVLASRLAAVGAAWTSIHAAILTHTHSDHWNERTFAQLFRRRIPVYCHPEQAEMLRSCSPSFCDLDDANLVHAYKAHANLIMTPGLVCRPLPLRHDGGATFGFRFEGASDLFGAASALGYAADLGCWDADLLKSLLDVDVLALEFNHDVDMEYASGRQPRLIARVLGDDGHLSNEQAAALLREVLRRSSAGRLKHVVQLHLSRDCNRPALAVAAARAVLAELHPGIKVRTARQDKPCSTIHVGGGPHSRPERPRSRKPRSATTCAPPWLPGLEAV
jgi:phosphoribosyl 1,2-cyclic phosphodiesterase